MRSFGKLVVYLLLTIGAVVMLMPFAWMIVTSFKLPSEVDVWPPQWGSRNFFSKRTVKVKGGFDAEAEAGTIEGSLREALASVALKQNENVFTLEVDDDLFYRGELHILLEGKPRYGTSNKVDNKTKALIDKIKELSGTMRMMGFRTVNLSSYKRLEDFFKDYFTQSVAEFDRLSLVPKLVATLNKYSTLIEKNGRGLILGLKRVKNQGDRERLKEFFEDVRGNFTLAAEKLKMYSKGSTQSLSYDEIKSISKILEEALRVSPPEVEDPFGRRLLKTLELKILKPVETLKERLDIHDQVIKAYERAQNREIQEKEIVAKFIPLQDRVKIFNKRVKEIPLLSQYLEKIGELESKGYKNFTERFSRKLDDELASYLRSLGFEPDLAYKRVSDLRNAISSVMNVLTESGTDVEEIISDSDTMADIKKKLTALLPESLLLRTQLSRLEVLVPKNVKAGTFVKRLIRESKALSVLRKVYSDSMSELKVIKAPMIVKNVRVKYDKEKYWEIIELVLKRDVPGVYLRDEKYRAAVFFNFKEVWANVFQNYADAWNAAPFGRYYVNTIFVATSTTILEVIMASMAAFAFSILRFRGRDLIFGIFVATMMVPGEVLLVPNYITISKFGWIDTYYALIIPWIVSVFAIFLIRQHFLTLPRELYDAAKIDGCSNWKYLWGIAVPLSKPVIITGALLKFVGSWNAFLWVLIVTNDPKYRTLPVGLYTFRGEAGDVYNQLMAAATFSVLPVIVLFLFAQKYFIRGIARTGLK